MNSEDKKIRLSGKEVAHIASRVSFLKLVAYISNTIILTIIFNSFYMYASPSDQTMDKQLTYKTTIESLEELIEDEMDDNDIVGLSIALFDEQRIIYSKGFGYADLEKKIPADTKTLYKLGTSSEVITSPAVYLLYKDGLLDIDQPLVKYIPEFSIKTRFKDDPLIKVRDLISHHSGIQSDIFKGMHSDNPQRFTSFINLLKNEYACYPPNYLFSFSSVGLSFLGIVIERVSGKDYEKFLQEKIFQPIGMMNTSFGAEPNDIRIYSKSYRDEEEIDPEKVRDIPANGIYSSVLDLAKYCQVFLNDGKSGGKRIFKPGSVKEMLTQINEKTELDFDLKQGCGWVLTGLGENMDYAGQLAWHEIHFQGFSGKLLFLLNHKIGIVVIANTGSQSPDTIAIEGIKSALLEKTGIEQPEWEEPEVDGSFSEKQLKSFAGSYATPFGVVDIKQSGDRLKAEMMDKTFIMKPNKSGNFSARVLILGFIQLKVGPLANLEFSFNEIDGKQILALHRYGERILAGQKANPLKIKQIWLKRLGNYKITNLESDKPTITEVRLAYEYSQLCAYYKSESSHKGREVRIGLQPVNDNELIIIGLGRWMGETVTFSEPTSKPTLEYSSYKFEKTY